MPKYIDVLRDASQRKLNLSDDEVYALAVNALYDGAELEEVLNILEKIGGNPYKRFIDNFEDIVYGYVGKLVEKNEYDKIRDLYDQLLDLDNTDIPGDVYTRVKTWVKLYTDPELLSSYIRLLEDTKKHDWIDMLKIRDKLSEAGKLEYINKVLKTSGIDPKKYWGNVVENALASLMEKDDLTAVESIYKRYGDLLGDDSRIKTKLWITYKHLSICGSLGDVECIEELLESMPEKYRRDLLLVGVEPILSNPSRYPLDILKRVSDLLDDYGFNDIVAKLDIYINAEKHGEAYIEALKKALKEIGEKLYDDMKSVLNTGDPRKIRDFVEKNRDVLSRIMLKNNIPLSDYLEAIAKYIEEIKGRIEDIVEESTRIEKMIDKVIEDMKHGSRPNIKISPRELEKLRESIESLVNDKYYRILINTGVIPRKIGESLNKIYGFTYLGEAILELINGNMGEADGLAVKAGNYYPNYRKLYDLVKLSLNASIDDIECILSNAGILGGEGGEHVKPYSLSKRSVPVVGSSTPRLRGYTRTGLGETGMGGGAHAPYPI